MSSIEITPHGHVAVVTFSAPPNNHVSVPLLRELADALDAIDRSNQFRVSVLRSEGRVFCAGAALKADNETGKPGATAELLYEQAVRLFGTLKPIVVAVQGAAIGAGLGLAMVADFRVLAPEARLAANFVKLGFHPGFGLTHSLPRVIGTQHATRMLLTGDRISGQEALAIGLADELVPAEALLQRSLALGESIAVNAPLAVEATRATLRRGLADAIRLAAEDELEQQVRLMGSSDFAEGLRSVSERRPGNFTRG